MASWDRMPLPLPFTRARIELAAPIWISGEAESDTISSKLEELQQKLERICRNGEDWRLL
jgi:lysophospholipid acyltransferase (LPLAT)-like uncharacterized protein